VPTAAMMMPIMEPVSRPELPAPLPLLPPEDEEPEVGVEEAPPKRLSLFVVATPVGKSISVERGC
jgi:hypothetical protein